MRIWPICFIVAGMDLFHPKAWAVLLHINVNYCEYFNQAINYERLYPKHDYKGDKRNSLNQERMLC